MKTFECLLKPFFRMTLFGNIFSVISHTKMSLNATVTQKQVTQAPLKTKSSRSFFNKNDASFFYGVHLLYNL